MKLIWDPFELATLSFSELTFPVFSTTSKVAVGLLNTGKYGQDGWIVGDFRGRFPSFGEGTQPSAGSRHGERHRRHDQVGRADNGGDRSTVADCTGTDKPERLGIKTKRKSTFGEGKI